LPSSPVRGDRTTVRAATEDDVPLLVRWHADPEVSRYWDDETFTEDEMRERLDRGEVESFVVEADGEPVGYIQAWEDEDEPLRGGIDMFLIPAARGRGLGPDAARALATHLLQDRGWARVTVDPYAWNDAAIRAWQRAGFEQVDERVRGPDEDHASPWLLFEFRPG
jgi:aminoglycoside 6'-N-acetyltransferase